MAKKDNEKSPERLQMEKGTPYPYYVFFILGNEFCERYAFYGMYSLFLVMNSVNVTHSRHARNLGHIFGEFIISATFLSWWF